MKNELGITFNTYVSVGKDRIIDDEGNTIISCAYGDYKQAEKNTEFIQDAFTVANETGLTPRQLKDDMEMYKNAFLEAMKLIIKYFPPSESDIKRLEEMSAAINNCENTLK